MVYCNVAGSGRAYCCSSYFLLTVSSGLLEYSEHNTFIVYYTRVYNFHRHHLYFITILFSSSSSTHNNHNQPCVHFRCPSLRLAPCRSLVIGRSALGSIMIDRSHHVT